MDETRSMAHRIQALYRRLELMRFLHFENRWWCMNVGEHRHRLEEDRPVPQVRPTGPPFPWWNNSHDADPKKPVLAGKDIDGGPLYVGRAWHEGHQLPAQIIPDHRRCYVVWGGRAHMKCFFHYEALHVLRGRVEWIEASDGDIPAQSFPIGSTKEGGQVFVARTIRQGIAGIGRILEGDECCYVQYSDYERSFRDYEVLAIL